MAEEEKAALDLAIKNAGIISDYLIGVLKVSPKMDDRPLGLNENTELSAALGILLKRQRETLNIIDEYHRMQNKEEITQEKVNGLSENIL